MGLLNSTELDWAVGIVFVYLLLSSIFTALYEWFAGLTRARARRDVDAPRKTVFSSLLG